LFVALFTIAVGIFGLISPEGGSAVRRIYFATSAGLYAAGAVRCAMGLIVFLAAPASRAPKTLRVLGAVMCLQALVAAILGPDRARAILEFEILQGNASLRAGAAVAAICGSFMAFALTGRRPEGGAKLAGSGPIGA
jgi:hypothetical protein